MDAIPPTSWLYEILREVIADFEIKDIDRS